jgi:hypothetical protein
MAPLKDRTYHVTLVLGNNITLKHTRKIHSLTQLTHSLNSLTHSLTRNNMKTLLEPWI